LSVKPFRKHDRIDEVSAFAATVHYLALASAAFSISQRGLLAIQDRE